MTSRVSMALPVCVNDQCRCVMKATSNSFSLQRACCACAGSTHSAYLTPTCLLLMMTTYWELSPNAEALFEYRSGPIDTISSWQSGKYSTRKCKAVMQCYANRSRGSLQQLLSADMCDRL